MNACTYSYNNQELVRISKATARKLFNQGKMVVTAPCNARLECFACELNPERSFESLVNEISYYNCNRGTGNYLSFYTAA